MKHEHYTTPRTFTKQFTKLFHSWTLRKKTKTITPSLTSMPKHTRKPDLNRELHLNYPTNRQLQSPTDVSPGSCSIQTIPIISATVAILMSIAEQQGGSVWTAHGASWHRWCYESLHRPPTPVAPSTTTVCPNHWSGGSWFLCSNLPVPVLLAAHVPIVYDSASCIIDEASAPPDYSERCAPETHSAHQPQVSYLHYTNFFSQVWQCMIKDYGYHTRYLCLILRWLS